MNLGSSVDVNGHGDSVVRTADIPDNTYVLISEDTPTKPNISFDRGYSEIKAYFEHHKKKGTLLSYELPPVTDFTESQNGTSYPVSYVFKKDGREVKAKIFQTNRNDDVRIAVFKGL